MEIMTKINTGGIYFVTSNNITREEKRPGKDTCITWVFVLSCS